MLTCTRMFLSHGTRHRVTRSFTSGNSFTAAVARIRETGATLTRFSVDHPRCLKFAWEVGVPSDHHRIEINLFSPHTGEQKSVLRATCCNPTVDLLVSLYYTFEQFVDESNIAEKTWALKMKCVNVSKKGKMDKKLLEDKNQGST